MSSLCSKGFQSWGVKSFQEVGQWWEAVDSENPGLNSPHPAIHLIGSNYSGLIAAIAPKGGLQGWMLILSPSPDAHTSTTNLPPSWKMERYRQYLRALSLQLKKQVWTLLPLFSISVSLGNLLNLSVSQFSHLQSGKNTVPTLQALVKINEWLT